jgi:carbamate kinase
LLEGGFVVIGVGGGGIPVVRDGEGNLRGREAVIDKDYASSLLASGLGADLLLISTAVDKVYLNFGQPDQKPLDHMSLDEAKGYLAEGHFLPGSMGPKMGAIIQYLEEGGKEALITTPENLALALKGEAGTRITMG